jgi:hypothetical protein
MKLQNFAFQVKATGCPTNSCHRNLASSVENASECRMKFWKHERVGFGKGDQNYGDENTNAY